MTNYYIRRTTASDNVLLAQIGAETFSDAFGADNTPENLAAYLTSAFSPEKQAAELAEPNSLFFIAEHDGEAVGYARIRFGATTPEVTGTKPMKLIRLYVRDPWIGKGVGSQLMEFCMDVGKQANCDIVWLTVWEHNAIGIAFYDKWGFTKVGTQMFQFGPDLQWDWVMSRPM